ncbi:hypothetical protein Acsp02_76010 [Actinoplanes sp. NBRC 103695]|nr:hypothetical protein Acsp02_76010 [Actinoplanes sp. NBRC 103695]
MTAATAVKTAAVMVSVTYAVCMRTGRDGTGKCDKNGRVGYPVRMKCPHCPDSGRGVKAQVKWIFAAGGEGRAGWAGSHRGRRWGVGPAGALWSRPRRNGCREALDAETAGGGVCDGVGGVAGGCRRRDDGGSGYDS